MSDGRRLLVRAASDLWTASRSAGICELTRQLDGSGFTRVVQATRIWRGEAAGRPQAARCQLTGRTAADGRTARDQPGQAR
jgi:hypothetical protein